MVYIKKKKKKKKIEKNNTKMILFKIYKYDCKMWREISSDK